MADVINLKCPVINVPEQHISLVVITAEIPKANRYPTGPNHGYLRCRSDSTMTDVIDLEDAIIAVEQHHVGFIDVGAEIAETSDLPAQSNLGNFRCRHNSTMADIVDLEDAIIVLNNIMSVSLALVLKSPKPATCQPNPTWAISAADTIVP